MKIATLIMAFVFWCFMGHAQSVAAWKIKDLETYIQQSSSPVIINFWATFCKPCIEEMPYFEMLTKKYEKNGVKLLLVSLDMPEQYPGDIASFITRRKLQSQVVWLNETNADYFCPKVDSSWSGSLPSSLFINNKTGYRKFFESKISKEDVEKQILGMLKNE